MQCLVQSDTTSRQGPFITRGSASPSPGADINTQASDNASALYEACKNEHEDVVEFLLSQGADANKANKDGLLPLHIASKKGNYRSAHATAHSHSTAVPGWLGKKGIPAQSLSRGPGKPGSGQCGGHVSSGRRELFGCEQACSDFLSVTSNLLHKLV
jgi:hypothetical protein